MRGMPKHLTAYGASKAGVAHLAEGIRAELIDTPIKVTTISRVYSYWKLMKVRKNYLLKWMKKLVQRLLAEAIEKAPVKAYVPKWPWFH